MLATCDRCIYITTYNHFGLYEMCLLIPLALRVMQFLFSLS